jgi:flagellar biosynthetic protein FlhB
VVITNPTHFAVALLYDQDTPAPVCVAKGVDHMALKIKERAKVAGVPIVENPPLARLLYRSVDLDQPIPADLYQAVAQVLAYVYKMKGAA